MLRFAPAGLVDSALNARHRRAAPVDVALLGAYMCQRHMVHSRYVACIRASTCMLHTYCAHMLSHVRASEKRAKSPWQSKCSARDE